MSLRNFVKENIERQPVQNLTQGLDKEAAEQLEEIEEELVCKGFVAQMKKEAASIDGLHPLEVSIIKAEQQK